MAISNEFKLAMKFRTRRRRHIEVVVFLGMVVIGFCSAARPFQAGLIYFYLYPVMKIWKGSYASWDLRRRVIPVSTLDDRAMLEHGVVFEELGKTKQKEILDEYRGGTLLMNSFPDEREHQLQAEAHLRAYSLMRVLLPVLLLVCWAAWRWVNGINVLVLLSWVVVLVLGLPQMIVMWTEPEDVRELQAQRTLEREA